MSKEEHYEKGMEHFGDDRLDLAIEELGRALEENPKYGDALHALAMCHYHNQDLDKAINYGTRFKDVAPKDPLAFTSLSMFYLAKGSKEKAEEMGGKAQALDFEQAQREAQERESGPAE